VAAAFVLAVAALLLAWRMRRRRTSLFPRGMRKEDLPLPRPYARLLRSLSAGGHRRSSGTTLEDMLAEAAGKIPSLLPDAARFLSLYHRDRFGPDPLSSGESAEAGRLADLLRRSLFRTGAT
jgi:hypothetical protein